MIYDSVDPEANIIFGAMVDPKMMSEVSITVLATGFSLGIADLLGGESKPAARPPSDAPRVPTFRAPPKKKVGGIRGFLRKLFGRK